MPTMATGISIPDDTEGVGFCIETKYTISTIIVIMTSMVITI
jgi:hypothetical protein